MVGLSAGSSLGALLLASAEAEHEVPIKASVFVVCLTKRNPDKAAESEVFFKNFENAVRNQGGMIQMRSNSSTNWHIVDGKDHWKAPNHLNPAIFDFDAMVIAAFPDHTDLMTWWASDEMFKLMKERSAIQKFGVFCCDGVHQGWDVLDRNKSVYGEKFIFLEFIKMEAFKPVQHYVDCYKRYSERALQEIGIECSLLFADSVTTVLMNEFPVEAICASCWRMRMDCNFWYDAEMYQRELLPLRRNYAKSLSLVSPIYEELTTEFLSRKEAKQNVLDRLMPNKPMK